MGALLMSLQPASHPRPHWRSSSSEASLLTAKIEIFILVPRVGPGPLKLTRPKQDYPDTRMSLPQQGSSSISEASLPTAKIDSLHIDRDI